MIPRESIKRFLARHRRHWLIKKIGLNLAYYSHGFENHDYDPRSNGERFVLERLSATKPNAVIFDVGAHYGEWAAMASEAVPQSAIHSFEVVPATFSKLAEQCKSLGNVTPHKVGLSDVDSEIEISISPENDTLSSGLAGLHGEFHKFEHYKISCPVTRGDQFCEKFAVEYVDFLKIDVEGLEPKVLAGFSEMLRKKKIGAIQFEYGQINLKPRFFLQDYYDLLRPHGMRLGKIYPSYVDFRDYHFTDDDLSGPNYLAVHESRSDYLRALES